MRDTVHHARMKTYGTCRYLPKSARWLIEAEPHVTMMVKRIIPGVSTQHGKLRISDTRKSAADIEWLLIRHPLEMSDQDRERLKERAKQHHDTAEHVAGILAGKVSAEKFDLAVPAREYQQVAASIWLRQGHLLLGDSVGLGKEQPIDSKVLTPTGYSRIGDIRVGDMVIGSDGKPTLVTGVFPQGRKSIYRVRFSDHSSVEAGDEHLWLLSYLVGGRRWGDIILSTNQLRTGAHVVRTWPNGVTGNWDIAKTRLYLPLLRAPVEFGEQSKLPIPAYATGQFISNGSMVGTSCELAVCAEDWEEISTRMRAEGAIFGCTQTRGNATHTIVLDTIQVCRALGLNVHSRNKFVPRQYMTASVRDRISLLHGLMDGDGSCSAERNKVTYHTTSRRLAGDVQELVECLGGIASVREYDRSSEGKPVEFQVRIKTPLWLNPFSTKRKASRVSEDRRRPTRTFAGVEYSRESEAVCIRVAADDHLYATEHAILTHNTASAICALTDPRTRPALVVTMTHLPLQWQREIAKFAPKLKTHIIRPGKPYDLTRIGARRGQSALPGIDSVPDVVITSYSKLATWSETLAKAGFQSVTFDECQELRRAKAKPGELTQKYRAAKHIVEDIPFRIGLSATPVYGYGSEAYNILQILAPGELGSKEEFAQEWCVREDGDKAPKIKHPRAFGSYLRETGLMLRRTREDVGRELPPIQQVPHYIDCDTAALDAISGKAAELARIILRQNESRPGEKMQASEELSNQLRQATGLGKAPFVAEFVRMLVESGEKVVLYGWHRSVFSVWMEKLCDLNPVMYTGSENAAQKDEARRRFIEGDSKVIIISLRSGAGLDGLQKASRIVVFGELDWSPGVMEQNEGRVYRDMQLSSVIAYYLMADHGSDPIMSDVLGIKKAQSDGIRDPNRDIIERLQTDGGHIKRLAADFLRQKGHSA